MYSHIRSECDLCSFSRYLIILCVFPSSVGNSSSSFLKKAKKKIRKRKREKKKDFKIEMKSKILLNSFMRADAVMCCLVCSRHTKLALQRKKERTSSWLKAWGGEGWRYSVDRWCLVFDYLFFSFLSVPSFWNVNIIVGYVRLDCVCQSLLDVIMCVCAVVVFVCFLGFSVWWSTGISLQRQEIYLCITRVWLVDCRQVSREKEMGRNLFI